MTNLMLFDLCNRNTNRVMLFMICSLIIVGAYSSQCSASGKLDGNFFDTLMTGFDPNNITRIHFTPYDNASIDKPRMCMKTDTISTPQNTETKEIFAKIRISNPGSINQENTTYFNVNQYVWIHKNAKEEGFSMVYRNRKPNILFVGLTATTAPNSSATSPVRTFYKENFKTEDFINSLQKYTDNESAIIFDDHDDTNLFNNIIEHHKFKKHFKEYYPGKSSRLYETIQNVNLIPGGNYANADSFKYISSFHSQVSNNNYYDEKFFDDFFTADGKGITREERPEQNTIDEAALKSQGITVTRDVDVTQTVKGQQVNYKVVETVFLQKINIGEVETITSIFTVRVEQSTFTIQSVSKEFVILSFEANDTNNETYLYQWIIEHFKIDDFAESLNKLSPTKVIFHGFGTPLGAQLQSKIVSNPEFSQICKRFGKHYMKKTDDEIPSYNTNRLLN